MLYKSYFFFYDHYHGETDQPMSNTKCLINIKYNRIAILI